MADSTTVKYLLKVTCDQTTKNYKNVTNDCKSTFPEEGFLEIGSVKRFHNMLEANGWGHHGWDYWRCPECEKP